MEEDKILHKSMSNLDFKTIIKTLRERDVDVDFRDVTHGLQTILMRICHVPVDDKTRREILYLILAQGPSVNLQDSSGRTALIHACIAEKLDVIQALSSVEDCDPNIADDDRNTALTYAVRSRKSSVVESLLVAFKNHGLNVNHRNNKGITALEEAVAHLDSETSKLLVRIGGADSSVLKQQGLLSPSPTRRNVSAVLPGPAPRSPLSRRRHEHHDPIRALSAPNGFIGRPVSPSGILGDTLTVDTPSSRGSSRASSLDDVQEDENEEEEELEYMQYHSNLKQNRRNSLSLPDLRDIPASLVGNNPVSSLNSSMELLTLRNSNSRLGSQNFTLPLLVEEDVDEDTDEEILPLNQGEGYSLQRSKNRRNSLSLPDLRDNLKCTDNNNHITDDCCASNDDIPKITEFENQRLNSQLLTNRSKYSNRLDFRKEKVDRKLPHEKQLFMKDKSNKYLLGLEFKA